MSEIVHLTCDDDAANATVADSSGGGNNGTATFNTADNSVAGLKPATNAALSLDGTSDRIEIPLGILDGATAYTFQVVFQPDMDATSTRGIVGFGKNTGSSRILWLYYDSNGRLTWQSSTTAAANDLNVVTSTGVLVDGETVVLAGTWDGTTARLYKDGVEIATDTTSGGTLAGANQESYVGRVWNFNHAKGVVDDFRLRDDALSAVEVAALYAGLSSSVNALRSHQQLLKPVDR